MTIYTKAVLVCDDCRGPQSAINVLVTFTGALVGNAVAPAHQDLISGWTFSGEPLAGGKQVCAACAEKQKIAFAWAQPREHGDPLERMRREDGSLETDAEFDRRRETVQKICNKIIADDLAEHGIVPAPHAPHDRQTEQTKNVRVTVEFPNGDRTEMEAPECAVIAGPFAGQFKVTLQDARVVPAGPVRDAQRAQRTLAFVAHQKAQANIHTASGAGLDALVLVLLDGFCPISRRKPSEPDVDLRDRMLAQYHLFRQAGGHRIDAFENPKQTIDQARAAAGLPTFSEAQRAARERAGLPNPPNTIENMRKYGTEVDELHPLTEVEQAIDDITRRPSLVGLTHAKILRDAIFALRDKEPKALAAERIPGCSHSSTKIRDLIDADGEVRRTATICTDCRTCIAISPPRQEEARRAASTSKECK